MLIPSLIILLLIVKASLSRRVNANSQQPVLWNDDNPKLIKKGEC